MKLARREKYLIVLAGCIISVALLVNFVAIPVFEGRGRLQAQTRAREKALAELVQLQAEYLSLQENSQGLQQRLADRPQNFTLFSFLEKAAGDASVKEHIKYMKPSVSSAEGPFKESLVEMKLEKINLQQLVDYLGRIESPENLVVIKRLSLQGDKKDAGYLDAVLQVLTFEPKSEV